MLNKMIQYRMLKHWGKKIQEKVSIEIIDGVVYIHIRDERFYDVPTALKYLKYIAENEIAWDAIDEKIPPGTVSTGERYAKAPAHKRKTIKRRNV